MKKLLLVTMLLIATNIFAQAGKTPFADYDSLSTAVDTLTRLDTNKYNHVNKIFLQWFQIWAVCDSAMYVSTESNFPANKTRLVKAGESYTSPMYDVSVANLYFKVVGVGKALLRREWWGK